MNWLTEPFSDSFMQRALVGGMLIGFANGYLGGFVVLRRLALMADALSHSMLPGLALGYLFAGGLMLAGLLAGGLAAALFVALGALLISRSSRLKEDTALAILYTIAMSLGLVMITKIHTGVQLNHYLFGNILGLSNTDLWLAYIVTLTGIPLLAAMQRSYLLLLFEPSVARSQGVRTGLMNLLLAVLLVVTMVASVHAVGVILMLGLLVTPAATIYLLSDSFPKMLWGGGIIGALGSAAGLVVSYHVEIPSGPAITLVLGAIFLLAWLFSPRYGVLRRFRRARHFHDESLARWPGHEEHQHE